MGYDHTLTENIVIKYLGTITSLQYCIEEYLKTRNDIGIPYV